MTSEETENKRKTNIYETIARTGLGKGREKSKLKKTEG